MTRFSSWLAVVLLACAMPACVNEAAADPAGEITTAEANLGAAKRALTPGLRLSVHTTLGVPEYARIGDPERPLLVKDEYVTAYDAKRKNPRWASWEVNAAWIGAAERSSRFRRDDAVPPSLPQATSDDFAMSGFQQGHVVPSADRTKSDAVNEATFVFTNVVPQTAASNLGTWKTLENRERALAAEGKHVFVIAGMLYENERVIGDGVAVPSSMFKVVVAIDSASPPTPADVTPSTHMIAVDIPNTNEVIGNYRDFRTTLADLEERTGFRLLSDVRQDVHDQLATTLDDL